MPHLCICRRKYTGKIDGWTIDAFVDGRTNRSTMAILTNNAPPGRAPKSPRDEAMKRIIASYRRKITTIYPTAQFDEEFTLGCTVEQFAQQLEASFTGDMAWANYGDAWTVCNVRPRKGLDMSDPDTFYGYFKADQFVALHNTRLPSWLKNLHGIKGDKPKGFKLKAGEQTEFDRE